MLTGRTAIGTASIVLIAIIVVVAVGIISLASQPTKVATTTSCSGYPPVGNCPGDYSYPFTLSVNYSGPWRLSYQGYLSSFGYGKAIPTNVTGSHSGTGFYSKNITLSGPGNYGLELCASAQKLDGSGSSLILKITGRNETSLPYGSVTYCGGVAP